MNKIVRTRIPPSPTGEDLHIGNLYTALINFAVARKNNGRFIVRIEDTDRERLVKGSEDKVLSTLKAYGIKYDEGPDVGGPFAPYRQSDRLEIYKKYAKELIEKGNAYYCFCSKERLDELRKKQTERKLIPRYDKHCLTVHSSQFTIHSGKPYVIRLNVRPDKTIFFNDLIRGEIKFDSNTIDDQVLIKSDGYPTYHLAVVVDDHLMEISHVIRGEDWISSTPKHVILYESFGWETPIFVHTPLLRNPDHSKLSKRKNPVWSSWYLEQGYLPEAVLNYLALMGWSHPEQKEIFSLDEFIRVFDLKDVKPVGPIFDLEKLQWMNGEYIRRMTVNELSEKFKVQPFDSAQGKSSKLTKELVERIIPIAQTRMKTLRDFDTLVMPFFDKVDFNLNEKEIEIARMLVQEFSKAEEWTSEKILEVVKAVLKTKQVRMPVLYKILIGRESGLPIAEMLEILGKEKTIAKIRYTFS